MQFELQRTLVSGKRHRDKVFRWSGAVPHFGAIEMICPARPYPSRNFDGGTRLQGENFPRIDYYAISHLNKPTLDGAEIRIFTGGDGEGQVAKLSQRLLPFRRHKRAARIEFAGRRYTYAEVGNKRNHALTRQGAILRMTRSSDWVLPEVIQGTAQGNFDSLDIALAIVFESVYTRELSWGGFILAAISRL